MNKVLAKFGGPDADTNWQYLAIPLCSIAVMTCFRGSLEGFLLRVEGGEDAWRPYAWSLARATYNAGLLLFWGFGMWVSGGIAKPWIKWAGQIFLSVLFISSVLTLALLAYTLSAS